MSDENERKRVDENEPIATMGDYSKEPTITSRRKSIVGIIVALGAATLAALGFVVWRRSKRPFGRLMGDVPMGKMIVGDDEEEPTRAVDASNDPDQTPENGNDGEEPAPETPEVEDENEDENGSSDAEPSESN